MKIKDIKIENILSFLLPFLFWVEFVVIVPGAKKVYASMFGGAPLPKGTEFILSISYPWWIALGVIFGASRLYIYERATNKRAMRLWWGVSCVCLIIVGVPLMLPLTYDMSHQLSHYFTESCNWDF